MGDTFQNLISSLRMYMESRSEGWNLIFASVLFIAAAVFFIWFAFYLRKEYLRKKATVDTFQEKVSGDLSYPGFYPGGAPEREKVELKNQPEKDKWGKINDEF